VVELVLIGRARRAGPDRPATVELAVVGLAAVELAPRVGLALVGAALAG
jgi:hypothetical protein